MTDLEMTKLCAEAMGYTPSVEYGWPQGASINYYDEHNEHHYYWRPLIDDAQAMALVKKFRLTVYWHEADPQGWLVSVPSVSVPADEYMGYGTGDKNVNAAIVRCVAKMQKAKEAA